MASSERYWKYAQECIRWAAETNEQNTQELLLDMAKAWTNVASVEADVTKQAAVDKFVGKAPH